MRIRLAPSLFSFALLLSLLSWISEFLWVEGDFEGHSFSLWGIIEDFNLTVNGAALLPGACFALICGSLPFCVGLFGIIRPGFKKLPVVSVSASVFVIIAIIGIHAVFLSMMVQEQLTAMSPGRGMYLVGMTLFVEIVASHIAGRKTTAPR